MTPDLMKMEVMKLARTLGALNTEELFSPFVEKNINHECSLTDSSRFQLLSSDYQLGNDEESF
ncbi:MAG: hypothetical protein Q7U98_07630 [Methylicorpusculum sp.]|uniref:hypothetical protein n=1 Tax=Methylicorpusculum sp. TaxID=2713644 RepID=UPI0027239B20|nr:hypothetical protein [Methylicorpusculum sp.]MDO8939016.1 hypothetical protein [Methylicorpusculum sp.]MDP2201838.1 hypothetical protein [Methylicorpusculum sp.]